LFFVVMRRLSERRIFDDLSREDDLPLRETACACARA